jgi:UPF0755 protein
MTTDLDLGLRHDDDLPPLRGRRRRRGGALVVLVALLVLAALVAGVLAGARALVSVLDVADYRGNGTGSVVLQVRTGDTAADIARTLADADVVKSEESFTRAADRDDRSRSVQPGFYRLRTQMKATRALALLLAPSSRVSSRVVVPEGTQLAAVLPLVAKNARIPLADLRAAATRPREFNLPTACGGQLEGCLFPATYLFPPGTSARDALGQMVARFAHAAEEVRLDAGAKTLRLSPAQVLTVASLLEEEAAVHADYPKVARVVYNRLAKGMPLQLDSTINYVRKERKFHLLLRDLKLNSPYNTYLHKGLPPTPISSPGAVALEAALHPAPGGWLYFVTIDKAGHTAFATSYQQFVKLKKQGAAAR